MNELLELGKQYGLLGLTTQQIIENFVRPYVKNARRLKQIALALGGGLAYFAGIDAPKELVGFAPHPLVGLAANAVLVAVGAKMSNDGINALDRMGDKR